VESGRTNDVQLYHEHGRYLHSNSNSEQRLYEHGIRNGHFQREHGHCIRSFVQHHYLYATDYDGVRYGHGIQR